MHREGRTGWNKAAEPAKLGELAALVRRAVKNERSPEQL